MRNALRIVSVMLAAGGLLAFSPKPEDVPVSDTDVQAGPEHVTAVVKGSNRFALRLLAISEAGKNAVFSPYSLSVALTMTRAGATGQTAQEMDALLGLGDVPSPRGDAAWTLARRQMEHQAKQWGDLAYTFSTANRLWASRDLNVNDQYLTLLKNYHLAGLGRLDHTKPDEAAAVVNNWVKEQTRGLIPSIITRDNIVSEGLVITNTIYFRGRWGEQFSKRATKTEPFSLYNGETVDAEMMRQVERFRYAQGVVASPDNRVEVQTLVMPYAGGASAVLILPREVEGLKPLVAALGTAEGAESLDAILGKVQSVRVNVSMPKFTIEGKASVAGQLKSLGVQRAFTDNAEFPLISPTALMIADVLHAAKMIVDEEGTEAAAATAVVMAPTSAMPMPEPDPVEFKADRPFLMIIRDEATGVWFFVARVEDPRSK